MRISELSRRTGVAVPTIKYYLREGLLPPGELSSPNQATYGDAHERRLRLIRALISIAGLPLATVREVLDAVSAPKRPIHHVLGAAQKSITRGDGAGGVPDAERQAAEQAVAELITQRGWRVPLDHPAARTLSDTLATMSHLGAPAVEKSLDAYAAASERIARADVDLVDEADTPEEMAEVVVVGTLLGDAALAALRRLAQQDASARRYGTAAEG